MTLVLRFSWRLHLNSLWCWRHFGTEIQLETSSQQFGNTDVILVQRFNWRLHLNSLVILTLFSYRDSSRDSTSTVVMLTSFWYWKSAGDSTSTVWGCWRHFGTEIQLETPPQQFVLSASEVKGRTPGEKLSHPTAKDQSLSRYVYKRLRCLW